MHFEDPVACNFRSLFLFLFLFSPALFHPRSLSAVKPAHATTVWYRTHTLALVVSFTPNYLPVCCLAFRRRCRFPFRGHIRSVQLPLYCTVQCARVYIFIGQSKTDGERESERFFHFMIVANTRCFIVEILANVYANARLRRWLNDNEADSSQAPTRGTSPPRRKFCNFCTDWRTTARSVCNQHWLYWWAKKFTPFLPTDWKGDTSSYKTNPSLVDLVAAFVSYCRLKIIVRYIL